jgi:glycosyltransferase involved in cell wall biosynthesis
LTLLAFRQVLDACPEARLTMAAEGPLLGPCRQMARALGMGDAVTFPGKLTPEEVAALFSQARAFVQHSAVASNGDSEGTPVAVIEAGASALPVIATRHAGIPDVVVEGQTGLLVDELDVAGMARHMIELAKDPGRAAQLGRQARRRVEERFALVDSIAKLRDFLRRCVERSRQ